MEINIVAKNSGIPFSEVEVGEVFYFDNEVFMKVDSWGRSDFNVVDLSEGLLTEFDDNAIVKKVKATLNVVEM